MPRIRTIKPEFPQSESMGRVSRDARLLFIELWTLADDSGRLRGNSRMLASLLFPYDDDAPGQIDGWLKQLEEQRCIVRYLADDGGSYVQICNWSDHQKVDKASPSKIPPPSDESIREHSRTLANDREPSRPSRARADQGPRTKEGTKDRDQEGTKEDCNEAASQPSLPPPDLSKLKFPEYPCIRGKSSDRQVWVLSDELAGRFRETFLAVNVEAECRKAHAWVMAKPERRKTAAGMEDFLRRWLAKEQNRSDRPAQRTFADLRVEGSQRAIEEFSNADF